jgi:hypothetical protein
MNGRHWSDYSETQLRAMRRGPVRASATPPDVTAETRRFLSGLPRTRPEPAYPAHWLPEVKASPLNESHEEYLRNMEPPHSNGTAPAGDPPADAYPAEWLQGFNPPNGGIGGEGFINRRAA